MDGPDHSFETRAAAGGAQCIAGVDEVGRGPLAGPVVAAAVVLDPTCIPEGLNDSKALTARRREALCDAVQAAHAVGIGQASVEEIDALNILQASHLAMVRAIAALPSAPDHLLIDGNRLPADLPCAAETIVKGDARSLSIAAASIVAKVWRDRLMVDLAQQCPGYGWERNAGYGSKEHRDAIQNLGITPFHRRSFAPVRNML
ncbi:ribonuclease HII [Aestuariibius sp. 2305UL40-4]|uniref:ribonuclease HII n=1 Tax=Aestuariibius violaceus TaxID=3234132 RepID=UPI00345EE90B